MVIATPYSLEEQPVGIIIHNGGQPKRPVRVWAYMWTMDEETATGHWHQRVPAERAA